MKTTKQVFICDLCKASHDASENTEIIHGWVKVDCSYTDPTGHTQDNDKHVCNACKGKIIKQVAKP